MTDGAFVDARKNLRGSLLVEDENLKVAMERAV
jgi:hypothetical protein